MIRRLSSNGRIICSALTFRARITLSFITQKNNSNRFHAVTKHPVSLIEWFSIECRKTKTKEVTLANHKGHGQIPSNFM